MPVWPTEAVPTPGGKDCAITALSNSQASGVHHCRSVLPSPKPSTTTEGCS